MRLFGLLLACTCIALPSNAQDDLPVSTPPAELRPEVVAPWSGGTLDGDEVTSEALRGRYVLIDFWSTWCGPCRAELPYLKEAAARFGDGLQVLGIIVMDNPEAIRTYALENEMTWPHLLDVAGTLRDQFQVRGIPDPILLGPDGHILERGWRLRGAQLLDTLAEHLE